ncbi:GNAT family N-acetyltransferase [Clostridium chromiireducens]|uniref:Acetyltransferase (GNAT) family protein n=1 Tax=Clostridium chromiireducens TaxID=225345 RepID=A0A1V4ID11_9CLOT|nr:GNAT family N-acetyltransferase [Clostridium chromiireducens]OPJ57744.1 acetyltransferase (GNAT) family protein [Clostridium chromiireducens]
MSNITNYENETFGKIRKAEIRDLETVVKFNYNLAKETEDKELDLEILSKGVKSILTDSSKGQYYVYEVDNKVVGQIMYTYEWSDWRNGTFLWVQSVYVDADYRKKGIYKKLYHNIKNICDNDENIAGIRLYVEKENVNAKSTYKSLGMCECNYHMYEYEK